ncbi:hypothetical protein PN499_14310 [Kamptonema animale CS-326]|nr:hypothetical protein [Kamptonema animale]MDB9512361.1 hypothetical protein [Kamptonema animale CS-326]
MSRIKKPGDTPSGDRTISITDQNTGEEISSFQSYESDRRMLSTQ